MLKITQSGNGIKRLRLEGKLSGLWVEELRSLCQLAVTDSKALVIDCAGLSFVDPLGASLLRSLRGADIVLTNCSPFLELQIAEVVAVEFEVKH